MQNYRGIFYFGEFKQNNFNTSYYSNESVNIHTLYFQFCLAREIHKIKGTQTLRVLQ